MIWAVNKLDQTNLIQFSFVVELNDDEWWYELNDEAFVQSSWVGVLTKLDSLITLEESVQDSAESKDYTVYNQLCDLREELETFSGEQEQISN